MNGHELRRSRLVPVALVCSGCEAILGFGNTSLSPPVDSSIGPRADGDASSNDHDTGAGTDSVTSEGLPDVWVDGPGDQISHDEGGDLGGGSGDDAVDVVTDKRSERGDADWTPLSLAGLALWLDAATGVETNAGAVARWRDQSPNGNDATALDPSFRSALDPNGIGSYPGLSFADGASLVVGDSPSLRFSTEDFVIEVVMRHKTPFSSNCFGVSYGALFAKQVTSSPFRGPALFANYVDPLSSNQQLTSALAGQLDFYTFVKTPDGMAYNDDKPRILGIYRRPEVLALRVDAAEIATQSTSLEFGQAINVDATGAPVYIGARPNQTECVVGVIAEIVAATHVTLAEVVALERYLSQKHADALGRD